MYITRIQTGHSEMPNRNYHQERREYKFDTLERSKLFEDPFEQFNQWLEFALAQSIHDPTAMALSTADHSGQPHCRIVLLKSFSSDGFVFYTHYDSDKGNEIAQNPLASLLFHWPELDRQIRIEGNISKTPYEESAAYFSSRPRDSQLTATISNQSQVVPSRKTLENNLEIATNEISDPIPCPENWGGYRLLPNRFEFWQGRPNRLHDRFVYMIPNHTSSGWQIERLSP